MYLSTVPLDPSTRRLRGMTADMFHSLLLSMAVLAYRGCHPSVTPANKAKALLNYMWRGVNCNEKVSLRPFAFSCSIAQSPPPAHFHLHPTHSPPPSAHMHINPPGGQGRPG